MNSVGELYRNADWKTEKHVPVIDVPERINAGEMVAVRITLGKEVAHPNTTAHHIAWIRLYFLGDGDEFPYEIGTVTFAAHGASPSGADTSGVYTHHEAVMQFKTEKQGTLFASSYCNIHGLWQSSKKIAIA